MTRCLTLLVLLALTGCRSTRQPETAPGPHLRVVTYNVNWGAPEAATAAQIIRNSQADVVCLQETTPQWEVLLRDALRNEYPFAEFRNSKGRMGGGLAFLSKLPAREIAYVPSDTGWFDGWIMGFQTPIGPLQVLNVHLRPPVSDNGSWVSGYVSTRDDRVREMDRFWSHRRDGVPMLVAGDFNDGEKSQVLQWLKERGMVNALPQFDRRTPTWQWQTSVAKISRRMDHVVYSPELHCHSARVIRDGASDHFPVEAVFSRTSINNNQRANNQ